MTWLQIYNCKASGRRLMNAVGREMNCWRVELVVKIHLNVNSIMFYIQVYTFEDADDGWVKMYFFPT